MVLHASSASVAVEGSQRQAPDRSCLPAVRVGDSRLSPLANSHDRLGETTLETKTANGEAMTSQAMSGSRQSRPSVTSFSSIGSVGSCSSDTYSACSEWDSSSGWLSDISELDLGVGSPGKHRLRRPPAAEDMISSSSVSTIASAYDGIEALRQSMRDSEAEQDAMDQLVTDLSSALTRLRVRSRQRSLSCAESQSTQSGSAIGRKHRRPVQRRIPALPEDEEATWGPSATDDVVSASITSSSNHPNLVGDECLEDDAFGDACVAVQPLRPKRKSAPNILQSSSPGSLHGQSTGEDDEDADDDDTDRVWDEQEAEDKRQLAYVHLWLSDQRHTWC